MATDREKFIADQLGNELPDTSVRARLIKAFGALLGRDIILKQSRSREPSYVMDEEIQLRSPHDDFEELYFTWCYSWVLQAIGDAIKQEVLRNGVRIEPKFKKKCEKCGKEYQEEPESEKCEVEDCGGNLVNPDYMQRGEIKRLVEEPHQSYTFENVLSSVLDWELSLGNVFLTVGSKTLSLNDNGVIQKVSKPWSINVEDARYFFPITDSLGRLGSYEYFCPKCWDNWIAENYLNPKGVIWSQPNIEFVVDIRSNEPKCPNCGGAVVPTCYVEKVQDNIQARYDKSEVIHGAMKRTLPDLYGKSKVRELREVVQTIRNMDAYNEEVYGIGHVDKLISTPLDENEITQMKTRIETELKSYKRREIQTRGRAKSRKPRLIFLTGKRGAERSYVLDVMPSLRDMQSTDFYDRYINACCAIYKVQPIFLTFTLQGRTGQTPVIGIRVQDRTTKSYQQYLEVLFNENVWQKFGVTDWVMKFNKAEERDELRDAQIIQTYMAAALTAIRAGLDAEYRDGQLIITGEGEYMEAMRGGGGAPFRGGEPRREEEGVAQGVGSVRPEAETRESEVTGELVQRSDENA